MPPTPHQDNLLLGAGQVFIDVHEDGLPTGNFRHFGNVETLELTTADDILIKRSSMSRTRPVYKKVTRSRDVTLRMVGSEFSFENLALLLMGDVAYMTQAAGAVTAEILKADLPVGTLGALLGDKYFQTSKLMIGTVSMDVGATPLVAGTDFVVHNAQMGVIKILPTSVVAVAAGDDLTIDYTPTAITGTDAPIVRGGTESEISATILYVSDNASGDNCILKIWTASLTPDGAVGLISEEFATFAINATIEDDSAGNFGGSAADPLYHLQYVPVMP